MYKKNLSRATLDRHKASSIYKLDKYFLNLWNVNAWIVHYLLQNWSPFFPLLNIRQEIISPFSYVLKLVIATRSQRFFLVRFYNRKRKLRDLINIWFGSLTNLWATLAFTLFWPCENLVIKYLRTGMALFILWFFLFRFLTTFNKFKHRIFRISKIKLINSN